MKAPDPIPDLELLIEDFKRSGLRELHGKHGDLEVYLSQDADAPGLDAPRQRVSAAPAAARPAGVAAVPAVVHAPAAPATEGTWGEGATVVRAPYLGTFYRSPKPGAAPYVELGGAVAADSELCLVEVMKLFTAVRAGVAGKVSQVLASDGELVSAGQPLFVIMAA
ncbi:MAG: biotin/lipoyl-containing protein [Pseudomonadota bacterium]